MKILKTKKFAQINNDKENLALALLDWHGGQWSALYSVGSTWLAGKEVPTRSIENAIEEIENLIKKKVNYPDAISEGNIQDLTAIKNRLKQEITTNKQAQVSDLKYLRIQPMDKSEGMYEIVISLNEKSNLGGQVIKTNLPLEEAKRQAKEWSELWGYPIVETDKSTRQKYNEWLNDYKQETNNKISFDVAGNKPIGAENVLLPCRAGRDKDGDFYQYKIKDILNNVGSGSTAEDVLKFIKKVVPPTYIYNDFEDIVISFKNYIRNNKKASVKKAQMISNPLDGKSNQQARTIVTKMIPYDSLKGFFNDKDWSGIKQIWNAFKSLDWQIISSDYYYDNNNPTSRMPAGKKWRFEISFNNNKGKPSKLYGTVVAAGAGTVEDPLSRYDITVQVS